MYLDNTDDMIGLVWGEIKGRKKDRKKGVKEHRKHLGLDLDTGGKEERKKERGKKEKTIEEKKIVS